MKVFVQYLLASTLPPLASIIFGIIRISPEECPQCILLLFVGAGLVSILLFMLDVTYFLYFIKIKSNLFRIMSAIIASFTPAVAFGYYVFFTYYNSNSSYNTDFEINLPSVLVSFIIGIWTFYKNALKPQPS